MHLPSVALDKWITWEQKHCKNDPTFDWLFKSLLTVKKKKRKKADIADILKCSQKEQISQFLCSMGSLRRKLNYGCMSEGELEVRRKWQELKCASYPWRQSDSPPVPLHLRGPWREDPQVVMVTKSNSMTQKSSSCSKKKIISVNQRGTLTYLGFCLIPQRHRRPGNTLNCQLYCSVVNETSVSSLLKCYVKQRVRKVME